MENKKVNAEQIDILFDFTRRKRVRHYDLQVELVDHFASAIEDLWREDPDLPFEQAIQKVYDKFPITGFASVIDQQTQAIQKEAWRWVFRTWTAYFHWPKVLLSIAVLMAMRLLFFLPVATGILFWSACCIILAGGCYTVYLSKRSAGKDGKRFLKLEATYGAISYFVNFINVLFYITIVTEFEAVSDMAAWLLSFFFTYLGFFMYVLFFQLPKRAKEELRRHFPGYA
jgi:hypothetical protein